MEWGLFGGVIVAWCAALCWFDVRERRLPNALTLPGVVVAAGVCAWAGLSDGAWAPAVGAALWTGANAVAFLGRGMGAGDVKLAPALGALVGGACGALAVLPAILAGQLITLAWAVLARDRSAPHGPAMCLAALATVGVGQAAGLGAGVVVVAAAGLG